MTTNGQSPFVTLFLHLEEGDPYIKENAMIIEEVIKTEISRNKKRSRSICNTSISKISICVR